MLFILSKIINQVIQVTETNKKAPQYVTLKGFFLFDFELEVETARVELASKTAPVSFLHVYLPFLISIRR